jgi:hypothetical protein
MVRFACRAKYEPRKGRKCERKVLKIMCNGQTWFRTYVYTMLLMYVWNEWSSGIALTVILHWKTFLPPKTKSPCFHHSQSVNNGNLRRVLISVECVCAAYALNFEWWGLKMHVVIVRKVKLIFHSFPTSSTIKLSNEKIFMSTICQRNSCSGIKIPFVLSPISFCTPLYTHRKGAINSLALVSLLIHQLDFTNGSMSIIYIHRSAIKAQSGFYINKQRYSNPQIIRL